MIRFTLFALLFSILAPDGHCAEASKQSAHIPGAPRLPPINLPEGPPAPYLEADDSDLADEDDDDISECGRTYDSDCSLTDFLNELYEAAKPEKWTELDQRIFDSDASEFIEKIAQQENEQVDTCIWLAHLLYETFLYTPREVMTALQMFSESGYSEVPVQRKSLDFIEDLVKSQQNIFEGVIETHRDGKEIDNRRFNILTTSIHYAVCQSSIRLLPASSTKALGCSHKESRFVLTKQKMQDVRHMDLVKFHPKDQPSYFVQLARCMLYMERIVRDHAVVYTIKKKPRVLGRTTVFDRLYRLGQLFSTVLKELSGSSNILYDYVIEHYDGGCTLTLPYLNPLVITRAKSLPAAVKLEQFTRINEKSIFFHKNSQNIPLDAAMEGQVNVPGRIRLHRVPIIIYPDTGHFEERLSALKEKPDNSKVVIIKKDPPKPSRLKSSISINQYHDLFDAYYRYLGIDSSEAARLIEFGLSKMPRAKLPIVLKFESRFEIVCS